MKTRRLLVVFMMLAVWVLGNVSPSAAGGLDENDEVQIVMGDLSALKTAAQTFYIDNGRPPPTLSSLLGYFDEDSLPSDASLLYSLKNDRTGWFVGYRSFDLSSQTHKLLEENAKTLGLVGDDLRNPWRRDSTFVWSNALALGGGGLRVRDPDAAANTTTTIRESNDFETVVGIAALLIGAATFIDSVKRDRRPHHYYSYPGQSWNWRSLVYHPAYRDRLYNRFSIQPSLRTPHRQLRPVHREIRRALPQRPGVERRTLR